LYKKERMSDIKYAFMGPSSVVGVSGDAGAVTISGSDLFVTPGEKLQHAKIGGASGSVEGSLKVVNASLMGSHNNNTLKAIGGIVMSGTTKNDSIISLNANHIELNSSSTNSLTMKVESTLIFNATDNGEIHLADNLKITNTEASTSVTSGSIVTAGGAGIAKDMYVGGNLDVESGSSITDGTATLLSGALSAVTTLGVTDVATFTNVTD